MTKGKAHYMQAVLDDSPVELFAPNHTVMVDYPYRLGNPGQGCSSPTLAGKSTYILDSRITDPDIGNVDVLERAEEIDCDYVVPADVMADREKTSEAIREFFQLLPDYDIGGAEVIIPIQHDGDVGGMGDSYDKDHVKHYQEVKNILEEFNRDIKDHKVAIGGVVKWDNPEQLQVSIMMREHTGIHQDLHGLGVGFDWDWTCIIRTLPWLFDSIDNSRSGQQIRNGKILSPELEVMTYKNPRGKNSTFLNALLQEHSLYMAVYLMTSYVRDTDAPTDVAGLPDDLREQVVAHMEWREEQPAEMEVIA